MLAIEHSVRNVAGRLEGNVVALSDPGTNSSGPHDIRAVVISPLYGPKIGTIQIWSGLLTDIPKGWALCDGTYPTPDLRHRFVIGIDTSTNARSDEGSIGNIGGTRFNTATQTLQYFSTGTTAVLPDANETNPSLENLPANSVLVARRLLPSDTVFLSRSSTVGVLAEFASHAVLFARELSIPCVGGILIPMVTTESDVVQVVKRLHELAAEMGFHELPRIVAMIETPAAALSIPSLKKHVDFFSIGSNDLTQYTMAAGRENPMVTEYFTDDHPTVLRLIELVVKESGDVPVSLCGELAGRIDVMPSLLRTGIRSLSVPAGLVPDVKNAIRLQSLGSHLLSFRC